jgi:hypothetical protein
MFLRLCLLGTLAAAGCSGSSSPPPTAASTPSQAQPAHAILVPNMT